MKHTLSTLIDLEISIKELDKRGGLRQSTMADIKQAIRNKREELQTQPPPEVTKPCIQWLPDKKTEGFTCFHCGGDRWSHPL